MANNRSETVRQAPAKRVYLWTEEGLARRRAANSNRREGQSLRNSDIVAFYASAGSLRKTARHFGISHERVRHIVYGLDSSGVPVP